MTNYIVKPTGNHPRGFCTECQEVHFWQNFYVVLPLVNGKEQYPALGVFCTPEAAQIDADYRQRRLDSVLAKRRM